MCTQKIDALPTELHLMTLVTRISVNHVFLVHKSLHQLSPFDHRNRQRRQSCFCVHKTSQTGKEDAFTNSWSKGVASSLGHNKSIHKDISVNHVALYTKSSNQPSFLEHRKRQSRPCQWCRQNFSDWERICFYNQLHLTQILSIIRSSVCLLEILKILSFLSCSTLEDPV